MTNEEIKTIKATGKTLGRLASEVAGALLGKDSVTFSKNTTLTRKVVVEEVEKMNISEKKMNEKEYQRYSGYPGGRKVKLMKQVVEQKGFAEILRKAVYNMLPANKLRKKRMQNLIIK